MKAVAFCFVVSLPKPKARNASFFIKPISIHQERGSQVIQVEFYTPKGEILRKEADRIMLLFWVNF